MKAININHVESRLYRLGLEFWRHGSLIRVVDRRESPPVMTLEPPEIRDRRFAVARLAYLVLLEGERINPRWLPHEG
jgi:hypothetical protein